MMPAWELFKAGGPFMWPLAACAVTAFAVALERYFYMEAAVRSLRRAMPAIMEKMKRSRVKEAVEDCDRSPFPGCRILKAGILKYDRPRSQIKEALEDSASLEIPELERGLPLLATIANCAPLLGLLGTSVGMIECFQSVAAAGAASRIVTTAELSVGIWQALLTASAGLVVAIPSFMAYNYLVTKIRGIVREIERSSSDLVNLLSE